MNYVVDSKKKPEISYPTQFEHTIHVGFDPVTSEFTVSCKLKLSVLSFMLDLRLTRNQSLVIFSCLPIRPSVEFEVVSLLL